MSAADVTTASGATSEPWWRDQLAVRWLVIALITGAVLRVAALADLSSLPFTHAPQVDAAAYDHGARRVAGGDLILADQVAGMGPGYFYVLGAVYASLGDGPWPIRIVQSLIGLLAVLLVFESARRVVGARRAVVAAALTAAYGPALFFESQLLGDSIALALHAGALVLLLVARERGTARSWLALGLVIGIAALFRPTALMLLLAVIVVATQSAGSLRARTAIAIALLGTALAIAPITARNIIAANEPVLITGHGGINLWLGNGPGATGAFRVPAEVPGATSPDAQFDAFRAIASREEGRALSIAETDRYWTGRSIEHVVTHPLEWSRTLARKLHLFWNGRELSDVYRYEFLRDRSEVLRWMISYSWIAPLALVGLLFAISRPRGSAASAVAWVGIAEMLATVAVLLSARYRLAAVPVLLVLAVLALDAVVSAARERSSRRGGILAAVLVVGIALAIPVRARPAQADGYLELGRAWEEQGDIEEARASYATSLSHEPEHIATLESAAVLEARVGHTDTARALFERLATAASTAGHATIAENARARGAALVEP